MEKVWSIQYIAETSIPLTDKNNTLELLHTKRSIVKSDPGETKATTVYLLRMHTGDVMSCWASPWVALMHSSVRACSIQCTKLGLWDLRALLMMHYPTAFTLQKENPPYLTAASNEPCLNSQMCGTKPVFDTAGLTETSEALKWEVRVFSAGHMWSVEIV